MDYIAVSNNEVVGTNSNSINASTITFEKKEEYYLTRAQFETRKNNGTLVPGSIYHITDDPTAQDIIDGVETAKKAEQDSNGEVISSTYRRVDDSYSSSEIDEIIGGDAEDSILNLIEKEKQERTEADNTLQQNIDTEELERQTTDNEILTQINKSVINNIDINYDGDNVTLNSHLINIHTDEVSTETDQLNLATTSTAGLMSSTDYNTIRNLVDRVENLEGKATRLLYTDKSDPTPQDIHNFVIGLGYESPFEGIQVVVSDTNHIWRYYDNEGSWKDDGLDTVQQFTNDLAGIIKGSTIDGRIYAETDGTGSVNGWSELKNKVTDNEVNIQQNTQDIDNLELNSATKVELQSEIDARIQADETKVDKITTTTNIKAYVTTVNGQSSLDVYNGATANTIPLRDVNGNIQVGTAISDNDAINKVYVDTELNNKVNIDAVQNKQLYSRNNRGVVTGISYNINPEENSFPVRGTGAVLKVGTPVSNEDATTKLYVDTELNNKVDKEEGKGLSTEDFTSEEKLTLSELKDLLDGNGIGKVDDVKVNGISVITEKVANIDIGDLTFSSQEQYINDSNFTQDIVLHNIAKTGRYSDLIDAPEIIDNLDSTSSTDVLSAKQGNELKKLINGIPRAQGYQSIEAMINSLNILDATAKSVGSNLLIQTLGVPDFWIFSVESTNVPYTYTTDEAFIEDVNTNGSVQVGYYKVSILESLKVDLTNYATLDDLDNYLLLTGGTLSGNLNVGSKVTISTGGEVKGAILKTTEVSDLNNTPSKYAVIDTDGTIKSRTLQETQEDLNIVVKTSENADKTASSMIVHENGTITLGAINSSLEDWVSDGTDILESSGLIIGTGGVHILAGETDGSPNSQILTSKLGVTLTYGNDNSYSTISISDKAYYNNKEIATVDQLENIQQDIFIQATSEDLTEFSDLSFENGTTNVLYGAGKLNNVEGFWANVSPLSSTGTLDGLPAYFGVTTSGINLNFGSNNLYLNENGIVFNTRPTVNTGSGVEQLAYVSEIPTESADLTELTEQVSQNTASITALNNKIPTVIDISSEGIA